MAAHSQVGSRTVWTVGLNLLALGGAVWVAWKTWEVISWVLIALFVALALNPLVEWLQRRQLRRGPAAGIVYLGVFLLLFVLVTSFVPLLVDQGRALAANAPTYLNDLRANPRVAWADARFGIIQRAEDLVRAHAANAALPLLGIVRSALLGLAEGLTILTLSLFMLLFGGDLVRRGLQWVKPQRRAHYQALAQRMTHSVGGYIAGTFFVSLTGAIVNGIALAILGVPYFLPLALAMLLLGVIPWIGSAIGAVLIFSTTAATLGVRRAVVALVVMLLWQQVEHRITPLIQARTVKMNALLLAIVALIGTGLAGILGAVLAVPVAGAVAVVAEDILHRRQLRWERAHSPDDDDQQLALPMFDDDDDAQTPSLPH